MDILKFIPNQTTAITDDIRRKNEPEQQGKNRGKISKLLGGFIVVTFALNVSVYNTPLTTNNFAGFVTSDGLKINLDFSRAEAATNSLKGASAEIFALFDSNPKNEQMKAEFIATFEKLSAENRDKVVKMYVAGKKEQPDKNKLMRGLDATSSLLWSLEVAKQFVDDYTVNGVAKPKGSFVGLTGDSVVLESFPKTGPKLIPLLAYPEKFKRLNDLVDTVIGEIIRKANAEILSNKDEIAPSKDDILQDKAELALHDLVDTVVAEILSKAKDEIAKSKPETAKNKIETALNDLVDTLIGEILRKAKDGIAKNKDEIGKNNDELAQRKAETRLVKEISEMLNVALDLSTRGRKGMVGE